MRVILDSVFVRLGSAPIGGGKKGEFRDWTIGYPKEARWHYFDGSRGYTLCQIACSNRLVEQLGVDGEAFTIICQPVVRG